MMLTGCKSRPHWEINKRSSTLRIPAQIKLMKKSEIICGRILTALIIIEVLTIILLSI